MTRAQSYFEIAFFEILLKYNFKRLCIFSRPGLEWNLATTNSHVWCGSSRNTLARWLSSEELENSIEVAPSNEECYMFYWHCHRIGLRRRRARLLNNIAQSIMSVKWMITLLSLNEGCQGMHHYVTPHFWDANVIKLGIELMPKWAMEYNYKATVIQRESS